MRFSPASYFEWRCGGELPFKNLIHRTFTSLALAAMAFNWTQAAGVENSSLAHLKSHKPNIKPDYHSLSLG